MADDSLKDTVLTRADQDPSLSEQGRFVVLAALDSPEDLVDALGGADADEGNAHGRTSRDRDARRRIPSVDHCAGLPGHRSESHGTAAARAGSDRDCGSKWFGQVHPGRGHRACADGSKLSVGQQKGVWSQAWRNLHAGDPAEIRIEIAEEGSGTTTIGVDWPSGDDVEVDAEKAGSSAVARKERPRVLGWETALEMYRPLLSYDELGHILEGTPSHFYDQLHRLLGLEQLTEAMQRLDAEVKQLRKPSADLKRVRDELKPVLESHPDPRAATALVQVKKTKPDLRGTAAVDH